MASTRMTAATGIAIGVAIGAAIGAATQHVGGWIAIGAGIGLVIPGMFSGKAQAPSEGSQPSTSGTEVPKTKN